MSTSTRTVTAGPAAGRAARQPRTAFVLAGGAALGAMQAGMVRALYQRGIAPDPLLGTSAGACQFAGCHLACNGPRRRSGTGDVL